MFGLSISGTDVLLTATRVSEAIESRLCVHLLQYVLDMLLLHELRLMGLYSKCWMI